MCQGIKKHRILKFTTCTLLYLLMTFMIKSPSKDFDQKMENKILSQYSYILQAEVKIWELIMVIGYFYQFSRTNHLLFHENFGMIFL